MTDPTTPTLPEESRGTNAHPGFRCDCGAHFDDVFPLMRHQEAECANPYSALNIVACWRGFNYMPVKMRQAIMRAVKASTAFEDAPTTPAAVDTAKGGEEPPERAGNEQARQLAEKIMADVNIPPEDAWDAAVIAIKHVQSHRAAARKVLIEHNDKIMTVEQAEREGDDP